jgi:hypothetical protein
LLTMKDFFSSRRTRYTAAVMLFVWLMSLGIGVANACLVQHNPAEDEFLGHTRSGYMSKATIERERALDNFAKAHVQADENDKLPEKVACLNFCAAEQNTLIKHHADALVAQDIVPVLFLTWLLMPALDSIPQPEAFGSPTWSEPPISIRYLRFTI